MSQPLGGLENVWTLTWGDWSSNMPRFYIPRVEQMHYVHALNASVRSRDFSENEGELNAWLETVSLLELHFKAWAKGGEGDNTPPPLVSVVALHWLWHHHGHFHKWQPSHLEFPGEHLGALEEMLHMCKRRRDKSLSRLTLHPDLPGTALIPACRLSALPASGTLALPTMSQFGQKLCDHPTYKPQGDEKQNSQLSFYSSNTLEQVALLISVQSAKQRFIISSRNHNALYAYIIPSQESLRVLYEASHFCNICDITPELPMTSVAARLNDLCKGTHQFRWRRTWKHYGHFNYLILQEPFSLQSSFLPTLWARPALF